MATPVRSREDGRDGHQRVARFVRLHEHLAGPAATEPEQVALTDEREPVQPERRAAPSTAQTYDLCVPLGVCRQHLVCLWRTRHHHSNFVHCLAQSTFGVHDYLYGWSGNRRSPRPICKLRHCPPTRVDRTVRITGI